ncbi:MAG: TraB/GumN family protein [archaeon]|nr:TraB/GumN family protein [archaeon]
MPKNIDKININNKEIILIGTAHISKESTELVKKTIKKEKPDTVCIELCKSRYDAITKRKKWENTKITEIIKNKKTYLFLSSLLLSTFQKKMGKEVGIRPGNEMIEAVKAAKNDRININLVDRDIQITLKRAWKTMGIIERYKLMYSLFDGLFFSDQDINKAQIESMKDKDMLNGMLRELGKQIPNIKKVVIDERDSYIAKKISDTKGKKIIAVVGAGHVEGIKKNLKKSKEPIDLKALEHIPDKKSITRYIGWSIPLIFAAIIAYGFIGHGTEVTISLLYQWFLINGSLSAIGAMLALANPLTIIVAFIAAPITSLNPVLAAGWFAGLTEAKIREPCMKDFESLSEINSIFDFWKNRVTKILLIVVFANIGSSIGTFVALPYLASLL